MKQKDPKFLKGILKLYSFIGYLLWFIAIIFISIPILPHIWYRVDASATEEEVENLYIPEFSTSFADINEQYSEQREYEENLPLFDNTLPTKNFIRIKSIGVDSPINEGENYETALETGAWIVNNYSTPDYSEYPVIIASHRFGYITWSTDFRKRISFYNLPKTDIGDTVEIIWEQREYIYEIYDIGEGNTITDYDADLILYTCKMYNSPIRIFRYLKRIN